MILIALIFSILNLQPIDTGNLSQVQQLSEISIVGGVNDIDFHPNESTHLTIAHESGSISIWDVSQSEVLQQWNISDHAIKKIKFLPDGQHIIYMADNNQIAILDTVEQTTYLLSQPTPDAVPTTFAVADNEWLAVGYWYGKVRLFQLDCKCLIHTFLNYNRPISTIDFSIDGDYLAYGSMSSVFLWEVQDIEGGKIFLSNIFEVGELNDLEFNPILREPLLIDTFASISNFISIQTWDTLPFLDQEIEKSPQQMAYPEHMSFSPNGNLVAVAGKETTAGGGCNTNYCPVEIIILKNYSSEIGFESIEIGSHDMWYADVDFNSDGRLLASASLDGVIKIWGVSIN